MNALQMGGWWRAWSNFDAQCDRSERVLTDLLVELAGSPDAHDGKPHTMPGNNPLAADAHGRLSNPRPTADVMTVTKQVSVEREVPGYRLGLEVQEDMRAGFGRQGRLRCCRAQIGNR